MNKLFIHSNDICPLKMGAYRILCYIRQLTEKNEHNVLIMLYKIIYIYKFTLKVMLDYCYSFYAYIIYLKLSRSEKFDKQINNKLFEGLCQYLLIKMPPMIKLKNLKVSNYDYIKNKYSS